MGMFDDIRVPVTLLKTCLKPKQFEVIKGTGKKFFFAQTKSFDAVMDTYLIKWKRLYKQDGEDEVFENRTNIVKFHNQVVDKNHNKHWFEFSVNIQQGKVEKVYLVSHKIETKEEYQKKRRETIKTINDEAKRRATVKYKVFDFFAGLFERAGAYLRLKTRS